jgi:predicted aspartyl protease
MAIHRLRASQPYLNIILQANERIGEAVALIDTGASMTAVHPRLVEQLQPTRIGNELVGRVNAAPVMQPTYFLTIRLGLDTQQFAVEVVSSIPASPCDLLIGRDVLSRWILFWDGAVDQLLISY